MPGGRRTERISTRDVEVLSFIARFGIVPRTAVAKWAGTGRTVTLTRERRLREAGLIEVRNGVGNMKLLTCTRAGLRLSGHGDLNMARFSLATIGHESVVAELAAELESRGEETLSEREMLAQERAHGERVYSAELPGGRLHRADLIRTSQGGPPEAIEVELAAKGAARLDELLRAWRRAVAEGRLGGVVYACGPRISRVVTKAIERTRTASAISVEEL